MDNYLESDEIIYQRIKYNNFRKYKTTFKNLNQIRKDNRKIRLYCSKFKNKNLDISLFHNDKEDSFIKYKNNTIFICYICYNNVYSKKKIKLDCGHNICIYCYDRLSNVYNQDFTCPFCRYLIRRRMIYNDNYMVNNNHNMFFYHIFFYALHFNFFKCFKKCFLNLLLFILVVSFCYFLIFIYTIHN